MLRPCNNFTKSDFLAGASASEHEAISKPNCACCGRVPSAPVGRDRSGRTGAISCSSTTPPPRSSRWLPRRGPSQLSDRRDTCLELLRSGRAAILEESVSAGPAQQVFLTAHRPVQIAGRNLLLSTSADITEQKALEDNLFRSAYYDQLTNLPTRSVIGIASTAC